MNYRENLKDKKRIVVKIGSSSITHPETGALNLTKLEVLVRELCDLKNRGKEVILVSSGAIAVGRQGDRCPSPTEKCFGEAGMCGDRTGTADDDLSEAVQ